MNETRFQLHHTGIKTLHCFYEFSSKKEFQLHHTGIKTEDGRFFFLWEKLFQLHHTGIKTTCGKKKGIGRISYFNCTIQELKLPTKLSRSPLPSYFNCTIQELKHRWGRAYGTFRTYFNCTIQELKRTFRLKRRKSQRLFQLHHTGIKTSALLGVYGLDYISIAPYRN